MATTTTTGATSFADLLREHRTRAGLSQEALAERAGLSTRAVSDLERGVKTRPYPNTLRLLADALDLDGDARTALATAARPSTATSLPPAPERSHLPIPPHPMLGREHELETALGWLRAGETRLLTLSGPGGVGKTRLAIAIATAIAQSAQVTWVELAPVPTGGDVLSTIAGRLGIRDGSDHDAALEAIRAALEASDQLLVLDNCEHVLPSVQACLGFLLNQPGPRIVATSRSPLRLRGERLLPLRPFAVPGPDGAAEDEQGSAAVELFVERAQAVHPGFALTPAKARAVVEICRRLDGLPLAIELAAVRIRTIPVEVLATLLEDRLRVLTDGPVDAPDRHRTLRAAVTWSYDLLDSVHQVLFRRLAVFAGGFSLEAVAAVATGGDPFATLDGLDGLADQGLITMRESATSDARYAMFEAVRELALDLLQMSADEPASRAAHAQAMLRFAKHATAGLSGPDRLCLASAPGRRRCQLPRRAGLGHLPRGGGWASGPAARAGNRPLDVVASAGPPPREQYLARPCARH